MSVRLQIFSLGLLLLLVGTVLGDWLNICQDQFRIKEGFYVYNSGCQDFDDDSLTRVAFNEDRELWVRNGTIEDIGRLLNGSLYNITNLRITNFASGGSSPIPVFPIESMRFSVLDVSNDGIERLQIEEDDFRLTHLDVRKNKLTDLSNMKRLTKLQSLKADDNAVEKFSWDDFQELTDLIVLSLARNRIKRLAASQQVSLLKLRSLDVSSNQLTTLDVTIWRFPQLASFYLHDNALTRITGLQGKFPKAWDIAMGGTNNWDCEWFDKVLQFLKQDRQFAMQMFGDKPSCPNETRMEDFICCQSIANVTDT